MIPLWKGKNPIYFGVITIIPFDNLYRRAYFVMHTFLVLLAIVFSVLPFSLGHCIFSPSFFSWTLYFQSFLFLLAIVFSVLPFSLGHCIFSPSFFSWHCIVCLSSNYGCRLHAWCLQACRHKQIYYIDGIIAYTRNEKFI